MATIVTVFTGTVSTATVFVVEIAKSLVEDWGAVAPAFEAMADTSGVHIHSVISLERLGGGFWAELWRADLDTSDGPRSVVLRRMPDPVLAVKEATVQGALASTGFPAPGVLWFDHGPEGPAQMVMELAVGSPILAGLEGPGALMRLARVAWAMPDLLAEVSSTLHAAAVAPVRAALEDVGNEAAVELDQVLGWLERGAADARREDLMRAMGALRSAQPELAPSVVCHGDLHPLNVMTDGVNWSLIDWTACALTDPAYDVAFTNMLLRHPPLAAPAALSPVLSMAGRGLASKFIRSYNRRTALAVTEERLRWFEAVHGFRMLLELHWLRAAHPSGVPQHHPWLSLEPHAKEALFDHPSTRSARLTHHR